MYKNLNYFISPAMSIAAAVQDNPYVMLVLEHFGITEPLQEKTVEDICHENSVNPDLFLTFANLYNGNNYASKTPFSFDDIITIVNYLKNSHWYYSNEIYPAILQIIRQIAARNSHKEVALAEKFFVEYFSEVNEHLEYENTILFPYVIGLYEKIKNNRNLPETNYSVKEYKDHHDDIELKLDDLKQLLVKYLPYKDDQALRRTLLFSLFELEYDLSIHSRIEELILIPLVAGMEAQQTDLK